jgi:hypothetical protein
MMMSLPRLTFAVVAGLLAAGIGLSALSGQMSDELGKVLRVRRLVKGQDAGGERSLRPADAIRLGQTITTRQDSAIEMSFDGDGRLLLWPKTQVILLQPGPPGDRHSECNRQVVARIELRRGDLQVDHDPKKVTLAPRVLEVETNDARICLFGTSIQVHVDPDLGTGVFVRETGAWVRHLKPGSEWVKLEASEQTFVRGEEKLRVTRVPRLTPPDLAREGRFLDSPLLDRIVF